MRVALYRQRPPIIRIQSTRAGMVTGGAASQRSSWSWAHRVPEPLEPGGRSASKDRTGESRLRATRRKSWVLKEQMETELPEGLRSVIRRAVTPMLEAARRAGW
jgi:hypothetical protein